MNHLPEPWKLRKIITSKVKNDDGRTFKTYRFGLEDTNRDEVLLSGANCLRIVACVNACAGIPDEILPMVKDLLDTIFSGPITITTSETAKINPGCLAAIEAYRNVIRRERHDT